MRKKVTLLKNSDINGWDNNKNNPDFFVDKNRNNISTPILQETGVDSYTIFSKYVTVEINDNIYNFFNNLFKELYSIIETCKMNGLRPVKYIAEILTKLTAGETNYMSLLPINNNKEY